MITRTMMTTYVLAYGVNMVFDLRFGLANIPMFTVYKFEIYRLFTSLFVCTSFFSLSLAYFSFLPTGKQLEYSMGSTEYACVLLTIGLMTNVLYLCSTFLLDGLLGGQYWLAIPSFGPWNVLFGVIAMECIQAPQNSTRNFLFLTIPTLYYPILVLFFYSFLGDLSIAHLISIGLGYSFGYGYLECFRISASRCKVWEQRYLQTFVNLETNYIASSTAMGPGAWNDDITMQRAENLNSFNDFFSRWSSHSQQHLPETSDVAMGSDDLSTPGASRPGQVIKSSTTAKNKNISDAPTTVLPTSGGQQLGGSSRILNQDHRQARLEALERRKITNCDRVHHHE